jgi:hypothetical protein
MEDLSITIIVAGIGLSIAYLRAELVVRQESKAAERKKELALRELHITRPRREHTALLGQPSAVSWPVQTNPFRLVRVFGPRITHLHTGTQYSAVLVSYVTNRLDFSRIADLNCRASQCGKWEYSHSENPL